VSETGPNRWWRLGLASVRPIAGGVVAVRSQGWERIPSRGPAVLAFGHVSVLDGPLLAIETMHRTHRPTRFLVAAEVFGRPVLGSILRRYEQIPIHRGEGDADALADAIRSLREGALVAIAPEGRVNGEPDGGLQRVRSGTARISLASGAALLPVGIWGTQSRWPKAGPRLRAAFRTPVGISIGPPILPVGDPDDADVVTALTARIADGLAQEMGRARTLAEGGVAEEPGTVARPGPSV